MCPFRAANSDDDFEDLRRLLEIMRDDSLINEKVKKMLKLDSYQRRLVLNNWLQQLLKQQKATQKLRRALSALYDDLIVKKVLKLINN